MKADVLVVGSGIAGCAAALAAAREGADVLVVTKATEPEDAASDWAQGGIAVTRSAPAEFAADIRRASDDTADPEAVETLVSESRAVVEDVLLDTLGVEFDAAGDGDAGDPGSGDAAGTDAADFDLAREAGHSSRRILHVDASTGAHVLRPFLKHLSARDGVRIVEDAMALDLLTEEGTVRGATVLAGGEVEPVFAGATVLATGGIGDCYARSTNPAGAAGDGVAMAALAGATVSDMQYVQFHPTAYDPRTDPRADDDARPFLVSEAVRGEGAVLRDADGRRFMPDVHEDAELAPRDVVARAVSRARDRTGRVVLDVADLAFRGEFPDLAALCDDRGVDLDAGIPVAPSEHFLCGGVAVDDRGRTSLSRLFAVGECARTGVHGANRLASTSLLEGLVWGVRAGETASDRGRGEAETVEYAPPRDSDPALPDAFADTKFDRLGRTMDEFVGIERTPDGLDTARARLRRLKGEVDAYARTRVSRAVYELRNACVASLLVARAAADAPSAGCHSLVDPDGREGSEGGDGGERGDDAGQGVTPSADD
ncbi:L-aspartate oxidase [Haloferax sulfurifontis]|uniref:L-aspartate oxidase n=1 Tax=Haloferax sulfurifontis ATCC BAA-897 TaxID=662480 RepID=M0I2Z7_9EURY|nr:FAD-dependent oxidoreductase [Haloferax sulfurifontis]ELZ91106.1 FAD binding domain protein [Haloferax sulfurifontis ATCC BAA-897]